MGFFKDEDGDLHPETTESISDGELAFMKSKAGFIEDLTMICRTGLGKHIYFHLENDLVSVEKLLQ